MICRFSIHCHKATRIGPYFGSKRGAALLAVLWVIALLIGLVAGASLLLTQDLDAAAAKRQVFRARMLAESALAIAMNDVQPDDPLLRRQISEDEEYEVQMTGEDGFLNPNILLQREDRETLRRVFRYWGMTLPQADELIDLLIDWVDADDFRRIKGAEKKEYGRTGKPFNRPFRSVEEMSMVRGMDVIEQAYPEWRTWFSVYASGVLDLNEARPEIVSAVLGVDMRSAQSLRRTRLGRDGLLNTQDDAILDLASALAILGIPNVNVANVGVQSATKRLVIRVRVGDLTRELSAVIRGAIGQGATAILHMSETNPIVETP
jgi:type II secretory pathway component PulK